MRKLTFTLAVLSLMSPVAHADCLDDAATYHRVQPLLLRSIAQHESQMNPHATHRNVDGSEDIGLMQINTSHLRELARFGITRTSLMDPCVNAYVGAWVLRKNIDRLGPTWKAVGAYNAASPHKQLRYANQIFAKWHALQSTSAQ